MLRTFQDFWRDVGLWEVGYWIPSGFEEQDDMLTVGDPSSSETHTHASTQRLDVQKPLWQWLRQQEPADCSLREWCPHQKLDCDGNNLLRAPRFSKSADGVLANVGNGIVLNANTSLHSESLTSGSLHRSISIEWY